MSDAAPPPEDEPISAELVPVDQVPQHLIEARIVAGHTPEEILENAGRIATALAGMIEQKGLAVALNNRDPDRKHVQVEGWQAAGAMLGALGGEPLHPEVVWARPVTDSQDQTGWECRVEIRTAAGVLVGSAESMCTRSERTWKNRDDYAIRSMAETRAESRAWRKASGWIVSMAGYSTTPAEEMPDYGNQGSAPAAPMFGPQLPEQNQAMVREALLQILEVPGGPPPAELARSVIGAVRQVVASYGVEAYTPDIAGAVFVKIAEALAYARSVAEQAQASPSAAAPADASPSTSTATAQPSGRVDPPDFATIADLNADAQLQAFRAVGCKCPSPPLPALPNRVPRYSPDCPVIGHEADGLGAT